MEAQGEKLLQDLVNQEQALIAKVESARAQAAKIVEDAHTEADTIRAQARAKGEEILQAQTAKAKAEAATARDDVLNHAQADVDKVKAQAQANLDKAVALVMERVLP